MNARVSAMLTLLVLLALCKVSPVSAAPTLADGTYTANYTVLKADNDSASLANDYFTKPATLIVKNGVIDVQVGLNHSDWIKSIEVNGVAPVVVDSDEDANIRTVQFRGNDLSEPIVSQIHVDIAEMNYNHVYTIRFSFEEDSIKWVESASASGGEASKAKAASVAAVVNPKTGDDAPLGWWILLFAVCSGILSVRLIVGKIRKEYIG